MGPNPLLGVIFLWIGGFCSATNFIPFRQIKRWSWEVYWIIQAFAAWIVMPAVLGCFFMPHTYSSLHRAFVADPRSVELAFFFGLLWGIGSIAFGLAIRYLGIALGYTLAFGCYVFFEVLAPVIHAGAIPMLSGHFAPAGLALCAIGLALSSMAAHRKELEMTVEVTLEAGERDYNFPHGLAMAALAGLAGIFLELGLEAARPITLLTQAELIQQARVETWSSLPALIVILGGGFLANLICSAILILRNRSTKQFLGEPGINPMRSVATSGRTLVDFDPLDPSTYDRLAPSALLANYLFAALAGVIWYFQLFFYSMGLTKMSKYDNSSWALHITSVIIFATIWGLVLREWHGTTARTKLLFACGVVLLVASTVVIGYRN